MISKFTIVYDSRNGKIFKGEHSDSNGYSRFSDNYIKIFDIYPVLRKIEQHLKLEVIYLNSDYKYFFDKNETIELKNYPIFSEKDII